MKDVVTEEYLLLQKLKVLIWVIKISMFYLYEKFRLSTMIDFHSCLFLCFYMSQKLLKLTSE